MEEIITKKKWWMGKVAYQIWPKSFSDGNGDGIGDLYGIIDKLDYLKQLGVDIIWISPLYRSPLVDQGYDISDYYDINPLFGDLDTMDRLIAEAKKRNIYIVMDLVVNHCSDEQTRMGSMADIFISLRKKMENCRATGARILVEVFGNLYREPINIICILSIRNSRILTGRIQSSEKRFIK